MKEIDKLDDGKSKVRVLGTDNDIVFSKISLEEYDAPEVPDIAKDATYLDDLVFSKIS